MVIRMIKDTEKRIDRRHDCDAKIKWTYFNRTAFNYGQEIFYRARALNFSESGFAQKDLAKRCQILKVTIAYARFRW